VLAKGFSLIEMLVAIAIIGVLMAVAIPSFKDMLQNTRVQNAAQNFQANIENLLTPTPSTLNWVIRYRDPAAPTNWLKVEVKSAAEGGADSATAGVSVNSLSVGEFGFTPLGRSTFGSASVVFMGAAGATSCQSHSPPGTIRCLAVEVSPGGQAHLCDPAVSIVGDTRKCNFTNAP